MLLRSLLLSVLALSLSLPAMASAAGRTAWVSSNHIQVIDLDEGQVVGRIPLQEFIHDMEFHPNGNSVYVSSSKGLRVADARSLSFTQRVSEQTTGALAISSDGSRLAAVHLPDRHTVQAARRANLPLPTGEVVVYDTAGMMKESSFHVSANTFDLALNPSGDTLYVLVPHEGTVYVHGLDGSLKETLRLAEDEAMLSKLALSPDGRTLVVPVTDSKASWLAEVDLAGARSAEERVLRRDLGHARRISATAWDEDGSGIYVTAIRSMVKYDQRSGLPVTWNAFPVNYVDVEPIPQSDHSVMITPTFSARNESGGLAIMTNGGEVVTMVELKDISPFVVAVAP